MCGVGTGMFPASGRIAARVLPMSVASRRETRVCTRPAPVRCLAEQVQQHQYAQDDQEQLNAATATLPLLCHAFLFPSLGGLPGSQGANDPAVLRAANRPRTDHLRLTGTTLCLDEL